MILADTNILARSIHRGHTHQQPAVDSMALLHSRDGELIVVFPQNLTEFYAICTQQSNGLGLSPDQAALEVEAAKKKFPLYPETPMIFTQLELLIAKYKPKGRKVFDMRLVASMLVYHIPRILTFNDPDFKHVPEIQALNPFDVLCIPRR